MTRRKHRFSLIRRHPRSRLLSDYIDDELPSDDRVKLEAHLAGCPRCRHLLDSLTTTVAALGSLGSEAPAGLAGSVIAAVRAEPAPGAGESARVTQPALAIASAAMRPAARDRWPDRARAALRWCCKPAQLRVTLPIAVLVGIALSFANQGGMLLDGRIDLSMCVMCGSDFLVPFFAVNAALLLIVRAPARRRL